MRWQRGSRCCWMRSPGMRSARTCGGSPCLPWPHSDSHSSILAPLPQHSVPTCLCFPSPCPSAAGDQEVLLPPPVPNCALTLCSCMGTVLQGKRNLFRSCFQSVFFLPPNEELQVLEASLCARELLDFSSSETAAVKERATGRMRTVGHLLAEFWPLEADPKEDGCAVEIPVLGKLLGHLLLRLFGEERTRPVALDAFYGYFKFTCQQKRLALAEANEELQAHREAELTSLLHVPSAGAFTEAFGKYLTPAGRRDVILAAIEAVRFCKEEDKRVARDILEVAMRSPEQWLTDVPAILRHILDGKEHRDKSGITQHSLDTLLLLMANLWPGKVIMTLLKIVPRRSRYWP
ncbi:uncharacterized protein [Pithys albifrons albifrons]|uniref:uncharacterized protein n=1 Tax=Pithys albifrons albifrons TaxID=3385563 RepID=UPI003A5CE86C